MGKNTSSVINQNSNNLWSTINSNNSDWIKNEGNILFTKMYKSLL